jgi:hypothetical protein
LPDSPIELTEYSTLSCPENFPTKGGALFNGFDLQTEGKLIEILWAATVLGAYVVTYGPKNYAFKVRGLNVLTAGIQKLEANG